MKNSLACSLCQPAGVALSLLAWHLCEPALQANPTGGSVAQGAATFNTSGSQFTVTTSASSYINWQTFNINPGETTTFVQPSAASVVWNQINDANPSQILGTLNANGYVILQNANGFNVGGSASINTGGLLLTTAPATPTLSSGDPWSFSAPPPLAKIINYGKINIAGGGSAFLIANDIENNGSISAPGGKIGLYAGQQVLVSTSPDGRSLSALVTLPQGSVDNEGRLVADGGTIAAQMKTVNQDGIVQADTVQNVNGVIELVASDSLTLGANSALSAQGDPTTAQPSTGGFVVLQSGNTFADKAGSTISVGGQTGGQDGIIEIFGNGTSAGTLQSSLGTYYALLINPYDLTLSGNPTDTSTANPNLNVTDLANYTRLDLHALDNIELSAALNLPDAQSPTSLNLSAGNNIILDDGAAIVAGNDWNVNLTAGTALPAGTTPAAGNDGIYLNCNSLNSGSGGAYIQAQNGNINLWAANEVQVAPGGTDQSTSDTTGFSGITTQNGGSINVTTVYGDVNTGQNPLGYSYSSSPYYSVVSGYQNNLGGISTANGGNVTITAGGNVTSYLPYSGSGNTASDGGTGAFGPLPGNVSITAGGSVYGHYVVADGTGQIQAGQDVGTADGNGVALSLINGSWTVNAPHGNIFLQEVRNPNGDFNDAGSLNSPGNFYFDYSPDASVSLNAGDGVYLTGLNVPRLPGDSVPVLYPSSLSITAGQGGVNLENNVTLFNSPDQNLNITTTDGGGLTAPGGLASNDYLLMSASSKTSWQSGNASIFTPQDNGSGTPTELNNPNPVVINIDGSMKYLNLFTTKETQIKVGGDMYDCGFSGENLHAADTTSIKVTGQIYNQGNYTLVTLPTAIPNLPTSDQPVGVTAAWDSIFSAGLDPSSPNLVTIASSQLGQLQTTLNSSVVLGLTLPSNIASTPSKWANYVLSEANLFSVTLANNVLVGTDQGLYYNAANNLLQASGPVSSTLLSALTHPITVLRLNNGVPVTTTVNGVTYFATDQVNWVPANDTPVVTALYNASLQSASGLNQIGYSIGGPGQFNVDAGSISLGNSDGILSCGVAPLYIGTAGANRYVNLGPETAVGASVNVTVSGDLNMLTSTIASVGGGDVTVTSTGGSLDLGSGNLVANQYLGYGIFTGGPGNVKVTALDDINIDSSRIASYDGGNVTIESLQGNVNIGTGGDTPIHVYTSFINPATGKGTLYAEYVYGSGIVANTLLPPAAGVKFPANPAKQPGNILVETPQGDITADLGGIVQEALDGNIGAGPTITLSAGTPPSGTPGQPGYFAGYTGNIDLGQSGVIGGTVNVSANGNVTGLVISRQASTITAAQNFSGTVLSGGAADVSGGGTVSGTIVGVGGASVSGASVTAAVLGQAVSVNGGASTSTLGSYANATATSQSAANQSDSASKEQLANNGDADDQKKKKLQPQITRVKRVTVILPGKA